MKKLYHTIQKTAEALGIYTPRSEPKYLREHNGRPLLVVNPGAVEERIRQDSYREFQKTPHASLLKANAENKLHLLTGEKNERGK